MTRKQELKNELEEMRKKWTEKTNELKKLEEDEDFIERVRRFSAYTFKCHVKYGADGLYPEKNQITPDDIRRAKVDFGIPGVSHYGGMSGDDYEVFLKDDADWERVNKLYKILSVVREVRGDGYAKADLDKPGTDLRRAEAVDKLMELLK